MQDITIPQLMKAGVHFGHQTKRWNPKMKRYIFGARNGVNILDLNQTIKHFRAAMNFARELGEKGGTLLFVGTKSQAKRIMREEADKSGSPYIVERWLGGAMTNFDTVKKSVHRLKELETMQENGTFEALMKKEVVKLQKELDKLQRNLGGIKNMDKLPDAIFIVDTIKEHIALQEALKLKIPVIAIVDTNCNPQGIEYIIPGNDDAIKSLRLISSSITEAYLQGVEDNKLKKQAQAEKEAAEVVSEPVAEEPEAKPTAADDRKKAE